MSEIETTGSDIAKLVRKSARSNVNFAFSPGFDAKDSYVALNKRKSASHLYKVAKREGPSQKVASGKMKLDGREVCLTCHTEIPALARKFKYFLQENGMSFKVRVLDKNGALIDTDQEKATRDEDEDANEDAGQAEEQEVSDTAPDGDSPQSAVGEDEADDLREEFSRLAPLVTRVAEGEDTGAARAIDQLGKAFEGFLEGEDPAKARKTLKVLKRKLVAAMRDAEEEPETTV